MFTSEKGFIWKSTWLDPGQLAILVKFYDSQDRVVAVGRAGFNVKGGTDVIR